MKSKESSNTTSIHQESTDIKRTDAVSGVTNISSTHFSLDDTSVATRSFKANLANGGIWMASQGNEKDVLPECLDKVSLREVLQSSRNGHVSRLYASDDELCWIVAVRHPLNDQKWQVQITDIGRQLTSYVQHLSETIKTEGALIDEGVAAVIVDGSHYVVSSNSQAKKLLEADDVVDGKEITSFLKSDSSIGHLLSSNEPTTGLVTLDSSGATLALAATPLLSGNEKRLLLFLTTRGQSEVDKSEVDSGEGHQLFEAVVRNVQSSVLIVRKADGVIAAANERASDLLEVPRGSLIGQSLGKHIASTDVLAELRQVLEEKNRINSYSLKVENGNDTERQILVSVEEVEYHGELCLMVVGHDHAMDLRAKDISSESKKMASKIFHASPAPTAITRESDGVFVAINQAMTDIIGKSADEVIGKSTVDIDFWESSEDRMQLQRQIQQEGPLHDFELNIEDKEGKPRTLLFSIQRIKVDGENCLLSVGNDITSRKEAARALEEAKNHAEQLVQFRTGVLTNVTHEVRTPLTVILGFTTMLRQGVREEYSRFVDLIERSGRRLLLTLDSVLDLAQLEAGTLEVDVGTYDMADLVSGSVEDMMQRSKKRGTKLETRIHASNAYVEVDFDLFKRALEHILDNAIKFTEDGMITIELDVQDGQVHLQIRDTGIGIEEEFIPQIFEAFRQESTGLERSYQGSGLGLTVTKQLVEKFGGSLSVCSTKGEGSTFTITLPQSARDRSRIAA